jgi:hypothetical protein
MVGTRKSLPLHGVGVSDPVDGVVKRCIAAGGAQRAPERGGAGERGVGAYGVTGECCAGPRGQQPVPPEQRGALGIDRRRGREPRGRQRIGRSRQRLAVTGGVRGAARARDLRPRGGPIDREVVVPRRAGGVCEREPVEGEREVERGDRVVRRATERTPGGLCGAQQVVQRVVALGPHEECGGEIGLDRRVPVRRVRGRLELEDRAVQRTAIVSAPEQVEQRGGVQRVGAQLGLERGTDPRGEREQRGGRRPRRRARGARDPAIFAWRGNLAAGGGPADRNADRRRHGRADPIEARHQRAGRRRAGSQPHRRGRGQDQQRTRCDCAVVAALHGSGCEGIAGAAGGQPSRCGCGRAGASVHTPGACARGRRRCDGAVRRPTIRVPARPGPAHIVRSDRPHLRPTVPA